MSKFCVVPIIFRVVEWSKALDGEPPLNVAGSNPTINIHIHNHQHHIITSHTIPTITYILPQSHNHSPTSSQSSTTTNTTTNNICNNTTYIYISSIYGESGIECLAAEIREVQGGKNVNRKRLVLKWRNSELWDDWLTFAKEQSRFIDILQIKYLLFSSQILLRHYAIFTSNTLDCPHSCSCSCCCCCSPHYNYYNYNYNTTEKRKQYYNHKQNHNHHVTLSTFSLLCALLLPHFI